MKQEVYVQTLEWLKTNPSLEELCTRFPNEWDAVQREMAGIIAGGADRPQ